LWSDLRRYVAFLRHLPSERNANKNTQQRYNKQRQPAKYHSVRALFLYPRIDRIQTKRSEFSPEHSSTQTEGQESLQRPSSIKISRSDDRNETYPYFRVAELTPDVCWINATKNPEYCGFNQSRFTLCQPTLARGPGVRPTKATYSHAGTIDIILSSLLLTEDRIWGRLVPEQAAQCWTQPGTALCDPEMRCRKVALHFGKNMQQNYELNYVIWQAAD
jgi:hypothetical protein